MIRGGPALLPALLLGSVLGCGEASREDAGATGAPTAPVPDALAPLRALESSRRASADFAHLPTSDAVSGPDPVRLVALAAAASPARFAGLLRGRDAVVLLDEHLAEIARAPAPPSPVAVAVDATGRLYVAGEVTGEIARFAVEANALRREGAIELEQVRALRDLATGPEGVLYAVEEHDHRLITLLPAARADAHGVIPARRADTPVGLGPIRVLRVGDRVLVDALLDHAIEIRAVDAKGEPVGTATRVQHDGPIWAVDAVETPAGLLAAAGGVEDHPLDRRGGSFGWIDSFAFLYLVPGGGAPVRVATVNVSELGVLTPKALHLAAEPGATRLGVTGYGGDRRAELRWGGDLGVAPLADTAAAPPGIAAGVALPGGDLACADPLLDAWVLLPRGATAPVLVSVPDAAAPRDPEARLGEALFFTKLMAPANRTEGELSRFTCETCHFEGYVDGRTHHTGRGEVRATTKPLLGLFNNRPHFSRALDPDLTTVAHAEFRVAGARSGADPWFQLRAGDAPWIAALGATDEAYNPDELRRALMVFLMGFTHRPNPAVLARRGPAASRFTDEERSGAEVFRDRCEACHEARLSTDEPRTRQPFERWEALVLSREGPLVWAMDERRKTGVQPYVHEEGARVPSLRRLYKKRPYLTNGSARDLGAVLERARFGAGSFFHDAAPADPSLLRLGDAERAALLAFLDLL